MNIAGGVKSLHMQQCLHHVPLCHTLPSVHMPYLRTDPPRTTRTAASFPQCSLHNSVSIHTATSLRKPSPVTARSGNGSSSDNGERQGGWQGDGVGPEGIAEDPVLHDLIMGMGSSGETGGEKPSGAPDNFSAEEAALALSMGSWRLRPKVNPIIEALVAQIEGSWRVILDSDLKLYQLPPRYRYMDSLDPGGSKELVHQLPDPVDKEDPVWPRLQVENRAYSSHAFRKLHLEVAVRQDGLQVVHCVMYPRPEFDLPILSMDLVANGDRITLAIVDPCPVTGNLSLPPFYAKSATDLQVKYGLESNRTIPDWGSAIFSKLCVIVRPTTPKEVASFLKYAIALTNVHVQNCRQFDVSFFL